MTSEIQKRERAAVSIYEPTDMTEALALAKHVAQSQLIPQAFQKREADVLVAMIWSKELGVSFMQGIQNIAVINGKPSIYGDLSMALLWQSGLIDEYEETYEGEGDKRTAVIKSKRVGVKSVVEKRFSLEDAKQAGLAGKEVWKKYTDDMLMWRTRGRIFDALYADVMKGLILAEEARDYPAPKATPPPTDVTPPAEKPPEQGEDPPAEIIPIDHPEKKEEAPGEPDASEAEIIDAETSDDPAPAGDQAPPAEAEDDNTPSGQLKKAVVNKRRYGWSVKRIEERYNKAWNELSAFEMKEVADAMRECKTDKAAVEKFLVARAEDDTPSSKEEDPLGSVGGEATAPPAEASTGADAKPDSPAFGKEVTIDEIDSLLKTLRDRGTSPEEELGMPANWDTIKNDQEMKDLEALRDDLKDFVAG